MATPEVEPSRYQCGKLGGNATVHLTFTVIPEANVRRCTRFDCNKKEQCGVGVQDADGNWNYEWQNCIHPNAT